MLIIGPHSLRIRLSVPNAMELTFAAGFPMLAAFQLILTECRAIQTVHRDTPRIGQLPIHTALPLRSTPSTAAMTGFSTCQICHGPDLAGGSIAVQTCLNTAGCHGATVGAPHSPAPWRGWSKDTYQYLYHKRRCMRPLPSGRQDASVLCPAAGRRPAGML